MPFNTGLSGLKAANADLRITGNNIANASTSGFKESRAEFSDVYAASVLGTSGNAIGTGVRITRVAQQFTQGTVTFTDNNLDLAVNGLGFFSLDKGGERLYSRAGAFSVDRIGNLVTGDGAQLRGYLPDFSTNPEGDISGAVGNMRLDTANIPPVATTNVTTTLNLDSSQSPPTSPFSTGFTSDNPPPINTYNNSSSISIFDSLGVSHIMTMYFVKNSTADNQWQMFLGIDGNDVTPEPTTAIPNPFTLKFDSNGRFVANDPSVPPTISASASTTSSAGSLVNVNALPTLANGELVINGNAIPASSADSESTSDASASAWAIANAIAGSTVSGFAATSSSVVPGLSVQVQAATLDLGEFSPPSPATFLSAGDLRINNVDVGDGSTVINNATDLVNRINAAMTAASVEIQASNPSGNKIVLTATADGRNIEIDTDGVVSNGMTLTNFSLGTPANKVIRGSVKLTGTGSQSITISGTAPLDAGFTAGTKFSTVAQSNSDIITIPNFDPGNGSSTQSITMDFSSSTQFGANFAIQSLVQNGSTTGRLAGLDADSSGVLFARFTNGRSKKLGQIILANFANAQGLQPQGDTSWSETFSSGAALEGVPQSSNLGAIQSGALEDSNVKLTEELVDLITAQRNFQANAQTIRTADTVTQTIINIR